MAKSNILRPFEPLALTYSMRDLMEMNDAGLLKFDIPMQRGYKWKDTKANNYKSKFIFSLLLNADVGKLSFNSVSDNPQEKVLEVIDGQQRQKTVFGFIKGDFALQNLKQQLEIGFGENKEIIDLNGKKFDDLPDKLKDKISNYKPAIVYYQQLTDDEKEYVFLAINNGLTLTNDEKTRTDIKDQTIIVNLASHSLFDKILSKVQKTNRDNEVIVKQIWGIMNHDDVAFTNAILYPLIQNADITEQQQIQITAILDRLSSCYELIKKKADIFSDKKEKSEMLRLSRKMFKKVHISSIAPVINKSVYDGISEQQLSEWLLHFFGTKEGSSLSKEYNQAALSGSASATAVKTRSTEAMKDYDEFIKNPSEPSQSEPEVQESKVNEDTTPIVNESESLPEPTNDVSNEVTLPDDTQAQTEQEAAQITFNEDQAKLNEQAYNTKRDHHKKK